MSDAPCPSSERQAAERMSRGELPSPTPFDSVTLFALRITGTGLAFRPSLSEFVYRPPGLFQSQRFLDMVSGCPLVVGHPASALLDGRELSDRCVGTIMFGYVRDRAVWGIAKVYDAVAASAMAKLQLSTSPCVRAGEGNRELQIGGTKLLIESLPRSLDHVAVCEQGVWDLGDAPDGVLVTMETTMPDNTDPMAGLLAKVAESLSAIGEKLDALTTRVDEMEPAKPVADAAKPKAADGEERAKMAEAQARADSVAQAFNRAAPRPLDGERPDAYRRRLLQPYLAHSPEFANVDLAGLDGKNLDAIETKVYSDAAVAAQTPIVEGINLEMRERRDASGRVIKEFFGHPRAWMSAFRLEPRRVVRFDKHSSERR